MSDTIYVHSKGHSYDPESDGPFAVYVVSEFMVTPEAKSHALAATTYVDINLHPCLVGSREHVMQNITFRAAVSLLVRGTKRLGIFRIYIVNGQDQVLIDWLGGIMFAPTWLGQYLSVLNRDKREIRS